ncbi:MAG: CDP-alcohol phosphatidyltransferase family protein, partial [Gemmatimonadota bacterium]
SWRERGRSQVAESTAAPRAPEVFVQRTEPSREVDVRREPRHWLRRFEAFALPRIARALPRFVLPDHLTLVGVGSAFASGACYALSARGPAWLWAANGLWIVNWLGDSLDGTLARVRRIERPRYGFYVDHLTDMFSAAAVCFGLGLSPYLLMPTALALLIGFYLLSINVYLETHVLGVFQFGYGRFGPTELRVILILAGGALALGLQPTLRVRGLALGPIDLLGLLAVAAMIGLLVRRIVSNLLHLARLEPPNVVKDAEGRESERS